MIRRVVILLLFAPSLFAEPDLSYMLKLSSQAARAQACPIGMDKALTNAHVTNGSGQWIWGLGDGEEFHGLTNTDWSDNFRDLAQISPATVQRFPKWYAIAEKAPVIGDRIWFVGYDWRDEKRGFSPRVFSGKVTRIQNGELVFDQQGQPGSSGSCILNEAGEVVAINKSGKDMDNGDETGQGIGIWGNWLALREQPRVEAESETPEYAVNQE